MFILLLILLATFIYYVMNNNNENFTSIKEEDIKQCNYNDKKLSKRCKKIRDGCSTLVKQEEKMITDIKKGCDLNKEANTVRETISNRRYCVTDVERLIRADYAKKELCAQIKNMPTQPNSPSLRPTNSENTVLPYSKGTYSEVKL